MTRLTSRFRRSPSIDCNIGNGNCSQPYTSTCDAPRTRGIRQAVAIRQGRPIAPRPAHPTDPAFASSPLGVDCIHPLSARNLPTCPSLFARSRRRRRRHETDLILECAVASPWHLIEVESSHAPSAIGLITFRKVYDEILFCFRDGERRPAENHYFKKSLHNQVAEPNISDCLSQRYRVCHPCAFYEEYGLSDTAGVNGAIK